MFRWMVEQHFVTGALKELFVDCKRPTLPMYTVYKNEEYLPFRVRAFIDFLSDYFQTERISLHERMRRTIESPKYNI
ncbi:hypothetical protein N475_22940 [Pseudoalteromonas luteoviolacea DSM 6061]|uniref:LysR substrate-binding domain-containing protein n=1 Tax=Pseudoalteromonas luteoviolacea DSM 6061 TaxID=1365250 RepID=A0A166V0W5_9GAMM|nr:hypothetical protein N475_22940 [Pseudoalteromonas luteoviolacea DSM 6061]MBE0389766.1 hypothetical protein [Pseudoalteromonas luteoviolacea DSM 6061]